jgi:hypothetical protein
MIRFSNKGDFKNTFNFLEKARNLKLKSSLAPYAQQGVSALARSTPADTGLTASSWGYEIVVKGGDVSIYWTNNEMAGSTPLVILLQYGHGTGTGGYVAGRDFINPAIIPVFESIAEQVWREVSSI